MPVIPAALVVVLVGGFFLFRRTDVRLVLMLAAAALLLLGGSMGGELLNPAAVEVAAISRATGVDGVTIIHNILPYNLLASGTALLVFWMMALIYERRARNASEAPEESGMTYAAGS